MRIRTAVFATSLAGTLMAMPAHASDRMSLADALMALSTRTATSFLFDPAILPPTRVKIPPPNLAVSDALARLLQGSDLSFRRAGPATFVIVRKPAPPPLRASTVAPSPEPLPVPDIVVMGSRGFDADIARSENGIQAYRQISRTDIEQSQASDLEDVIRSTLTTNTQIYTLAQYGGGNGGLNRSQIDLRGLGLYRTLILVDGRRLPSFPDFGSFLQPDINGIPPESIERVETLASTAGGIYGPGATGGVLNIILKRNYDGASIKMTSGITDRGDGLIRQIDGQVGWTSPDGGTRISLSGTHSERDGLLVGDRAFGQAALVAQVTNQPSPYAMPPIGASLNVLGFLPLTFGAGSGGTTIPGTTTHLGAGSSLTPSQAASQLTANAGGYDLSLSHDGAGTLLTLYPRLETNSAIVGLRQSITPWLEAFVDGMYLSNGGHGQGQPFGLQSSLLLLAGQNGNPFLYPVFVSFSAPGLVSTAYSKSITERGTIGLVARLPHRWGAEIDFTAGRSTLLNGTSYYGALPASVDLFSGSNAFQAVAAEGPTLHTRLREHNTLYDVAARLAGPLVDLPAGPVTLTTSGEYRYERGPGAQSSTFNVLTDTETTTHEPSQHESAASGLIELDVPLTAEDSHLPLLRALAIQLSGRFDSLALQTFTGVTNNSGLYTQAHGHYDTFAYTLGTRFKPLPGVMMRASFATGYVPPDPDQLYGTQSSYPYFLTNDPKRGGSQAGVPGSFSVLYAGSPNIRPEKAQTISAGVVLTPFGSAGPRVSLDWTRIETSKEITTFGSYNAQYIITHEDEFPGRVTRAAPTAADLAKGYTVGVITAVDDTYLQVGRTHIDAIDAAFDYKTRPSPLGQFGLRLLATWQPHFRRRGDPNAAYDELSDHSDGPLAWRASGSISWTRGLVGLAVTGRYYGRYYVYSGVSSSLSAFYDNYLSVQQGSDHIPAQAYFDALATLRLRPRGLAHDVKLQFGIQNLFDHMPPLVVAPVIGIAEPNYSPYGDPYGRRFRISAEIAF